MAKKQNVKPVFDPALLSDAEIQEYTNDNMWADSAGGRKLCAFAREVLRLRNEIRQIEEIIGTYKDSYDEE